MKYVKIYMVTILAILFFVGCADNPYVAQGTADKFASNSNKYQFRTYKNYLTLAYLAGTDTSTPTLDVVLSLGKDVECIKNVNLSLYMPSLWGTQYPFQSSVTWYGIHKGHNLIVLADGQRLVFPVRSSSKRNSINNGYDAIHKTYTTYYMEDVIYGATLEQIGKIAKAKVVELRIENNSIKYDLGKDTINKNFVKHIRRFYNEQILTRKVCR